VDWTDPAPEEVADGVFRIALPLPHDALRAVNVYALTGSDGLSLIDGGWAAASATEALAEALQSLGWQLAEIEQCLVTHIHRDHYTEAVRLQREHGVRLGLGQGEQANLEQILAWGNRPAFADTLGFLRRCGAGELLAEVARLPVPPREADDWHRPDRWLVDGTAVTAGGRSLAVLATPGHTAGHVVFHDAADRVLFAGDHVLPHITPSIGFEPVRVPYPLRDFLDSLQLLLRQPDARLLPAHGPVAESVHQRVQQLLDHHERRLAATETVVRSGAHTALAVAERLPWTRRERALTELDLFNRMLAVSETSAHLDVLVLQGRLCSEAVEEIERYRVS